MLKYDYIQPLMVFDRLSRRFVGPDQESDLISSALEPRRGIALKARFGTTEQVKLKISTDNFILSMGDGFLERASSGNTLTIWPPREMLPPGVLNLSTTKKDVKGKAKGKGKGKVRDLCKRKEKVEASRTRIKVCHNPMQYIFFF